MDTPFSRDRFPKLSDCIRRVVESHPHSKLTGLGVSELRKLECKYATKAARGDADARRELDDIRGILKGKRMKESLDAVNRQHGGALERMDEAALKASSDTLRKKYDRHEGDVISHMDYSGRTPGSPVNTPHTQRRMGRKHTAMALIKREMDRRGERVGYQPPKSSPEFIARQEKEREQERAQARREREQRESNPVYQRNVAKYKEFLAKRDANRKARRGG
jgi:hypothetical protein